MFCAVSWLIEVCCRVLLRAVFKMPETQILGLTGNYEKIPFRMTDVYFNFTNSLSTCGTVGHRLLDGITTFA